ncbi:unnamed protein product [Fraxinus pennsylvanica]|uniref:methylcrotonoyl-CoA carboxylase n=1 Tax=Fraxinus pennsylvanica TaxID=56036 RepID=A0AAD1ZMZ0_9LAMI|nr:unnamed protein product [Fraxinus pennsylvanica]
MAEALCVVLVLIQTLEPAAVRRGERVFVPRFLLFCGRGRGVAKKKETTRSLTRLVALLAIFYNGNTSAGPGKEFGSMNMEDLLKSIWTAEETQAMSSCPGSGNGIAPVGNLQRQGSLSLPRTLSQKTVDEVWRDVLKETVGAKDGSADGGSNLEVRQPTLGEMTLEEFLVRAGVVREDIQPSWLANNNGIYGGLPAASGFNNGSTIGFQQPSRNQGMLGNQHAKNNNVVHNLQALEKNMGGVISLEQQPRQPQPLLPKQTVLSSPMQLGNNGKLGGVISLEQQPRQPQPLFPKQTFKVEQWPWGHYAMGARQLQEGGRGRRSSTSLEKVVERRRKRMMKNRESAARSRSRKQAYTLELEAEIAKLREMNQEFRKKQAEYMEMQKNQISDETILPRACKRICLRRALTGPCFGSEPHPELLFRGPSRHTRPVDRGSESFATNSKVMEGHISQLHPHIQMVLNGGGQEAVKRNRSRNKLLPRERIDRLIDPGSAFLELSQLAGHELYEEPLPSGGIITGVGPVHGKLCMFVANDPTVKGGTYYPITVKKHLRAQEIAAKCRLPCIDACRRHSPNCAGTYIPAMADESVMVQGNGTIFLAGPPLVKAATGEEVSAEDLGGATVHSRTSGVSDYFAQDALAIGRNIIKNLHVASGANDHVVSDFKEPLYDVEELRSIAPTDLKQSLDIRSIIARIVDGSEFDEFKKLYGTTLVTGFARIHGQPVGILGNNGILFNESALKGAHLIELCTQRNIPLIFLQNITGFMNICDGRSSGCRVLAQIERGNRKKAGIQWSKEEENFRDSVVEAYDRECSAYYSTVRLWDDGLIDPADTRKIVGLCIAASMNRKPESTKYGVFRM